MHSSEDVYKILERTTMLARVKQLDTRIFARYIGDSIGGAWCVDVLVHGSDFFRKILLSCSIFIYADCIVVYREC